MGGVIEARFILLDDFRGGGRDIFINFLFVMGLESCWVFLYIVFLFVFISILRGRCYFFRVYREDSRVLERWWTLIKLFIVRGGVFGRFGIKV